jgi:hypothetical protein
MLWRDDQDGGDGRRGGDGADADGPHEEARQALRMLRRAMVVAAVVVCVVTAFANWPV